MATKDYKYESTCSSKHELMISVKNYSSAQTSTHHLV